MNVEDVHTGIKTGIRYDMVNGLGGTRAATYLRCRSLDEKMDLEILI